VTFTIKRVSASTSPTGNPPYLNGEAKFSIKPLNIDGCSVVNDGASLTGANAGVTLVQTPDYGSNTLWVTYYGIHPGTDTVTILPVISGCSSRVYYPQYSGNTSYKESWNAVPPTGSCPAQPLSPSLMRSAIRTRRYMVFRNHSCVDDPVGEGFGDYESSVTDATVAAPGLPFAFTRTFSSGYAHQGDLGNGWTEPYDSYLNIDTTSTPNTVTAFMGDGQQIRFTKSGSSWVAPAYTIATLTYSSSTSTYSFVDGNRTTWKFASNGALNSISDRNGNTTTVSGWKDWPTGVTLSNGKAVSFTTNGSGEITKITLPDGRTVTYTYSSANDLATVTDLRGGVTSYTYNSAHQILTVTDPRGHVVVTNTYGDYGRLASQTDALGNTTNYVVSQISCPPYCGFNSESYATDARGNTWDDTYSFDGQLLAQSDPLGETTAYTYDATTQLPLSYTDPLGNTVSYGYDSQQNPTLTTLPGSITTSATYDSSNNQLTATDGRGYTSSYTYDTHGNPTLVTQPGGNTIGMAYNSAGQLTSITNQAGKTSSSTYDTAGNLASVTTPLGNKTTYGYDTTGRQTSIVDPRGNVTGGTPSAHTKTIAYNAADQVTSVTDQLGHTTSYTYDADGNLTSVTDPDSNTWTYTYDADNRLTKVTAPDASTTTFAYDQVGNLISRTDANGNATVYAYDSANRLITITDPLSRTWTLGYDADSNIISIAYPSGGTVHYTYDALGQRTGTTYTDSTPSVSWSYDADGNIASMTDGAGTVNYTYNNLDQLTQAARGTDSFNYTYDPVGRIASRQIPDGTTTSYAYDNDGNLTTATTGSDVTSYLYDPAGALTQTTLPNSVVETNTIDAASRITQRNDGFRAFSYGYDPAGNLTSRTVGGVTDNYSYDTLDRLTDITGGLTVHYTYDPVGNRTSMVDSSGTTTYSYDLGDQLQSAAGPSGTTSYALDQNGNETAAGGWNYTFNLAGQLTGASNGSTSASYSYDGAGNRLSATVASATTNYLWDSNFSLPQLALERDSSSSLIRRYTYGNGRISMTTPSTTAYYSTDPTGTVTEMSGAGGTQLGQYDSNPFGDNATATGVDPSVAGNPYGFAGEYQDPTTGLYNLRARQYDPTSSRFLSRDPLGPQDYASLYTYVANNPLGYIDPSGMQRQPSCPILGCVLHMWHPGLNSVSPTTLIHVAATAGALQACLDLAEATTVLGAPEAAPLTCALAAAGAFALDRAASGGR
jgi:RHS repeat-associated protein